MAFTEYPKRQGHRRELISIFSAFFRLWPTFFSKTAHYLNNLYYYQLHDSGWGDYPSRAESMDKQVILQFVQAPALLQANP
ncbi:MAG: hypothetical protein ACR5LC_03110 [Symbiopectobacterium sp.]